MSDLLYYILCSLLSLGVLSGIRLMSKVETAARGNQLSALCMLAAIVITMVRTDLAGSLVYIILGLLSGTFLSILLTIRVKMIQMPQMVGLLNGLGGLASALSAVLVIASGQGQNTFELAASGLALAVGAATFSGSMVAAAKLHNLMPQRSALLRGHRLLTAAAALISLALVTALPLVQQGRLGLGIILAVFALGFGYLFALRVGGADMPITISLLNSTSGVAAAISGMALGDVLLVAVGGIVGASGMLLTQIMCRSMNRKLSSVLFGGAPKPALEKESLENAVDGQALRKDTEDKPAPAGASLENAGKWLEEARTVVIIPGYGMALSQAQEKVKLLSDRFAAKGKQVRFAIHPVAGRMPGHMNVLLAEVDVPYELLFEMDDINPDFPDTDLAIVIGANDVINPAANTAQGTPIYGMPILDAGKARHLIICNYDDRPGYAGVPNPLYQPRPEVLVLLGDAKESLDKLLAML